MTTQNQIVEQLGKALLLEASEQKTLKLASDWLAKQKQLGTAKEIKKVIICAYADGILYGNWPWDK